MKDKFQISDDTLLQRRRDLTSAEVDGEALILDAESGRCVELDAIGTLIWGGLAKETSLAKLFDSLCYAFGNSVARETCRKDTLKLLSVLRKNGFLLLGKPEPLQQLSPTPDCTDKGAKNGVFDDLFWRTKECDASERRLTAELVLPRMDDLLDELGKLRGTIDQAVARMWQERSANESLPKLATRSASPEFATPKLQELVAERFGSPANLADYPVGFCRQITEVVYGMIVLQGAPFEHLGTLMEFKKRGGIFQLIWGSIRDVYFQTAMQVGTQYVDVANDTVDPTKPPVETASLARSGFKCFTSIEEYARVKKVYHGVELYVNDLFPMWTAVCPLIEIDPKKGTVRFDRCAKQIRWALSVGNRAFFDGLWNGDIPRWEQVDLRAGLTGPFRCDEPALAEEFSRQDFNDQLDRLLSMSREDVFARVSAAKNWARFVHRVWARTRDSTD